jgi:hypothetical protein
MKEFILIKYLHYQKTYGLDCSLRCIENNGSFNTYYNIIERTITFENLNNHCLKFKSEQDKYNFISSVFAHEYRHALVHINSSFLNRIILVLDALRLLLEMVIKKKKRTLIVILLFSSIFFDNFNLWTYFWLFSATLNLPVVLSEFDANIFAIKKEGYHRGLLMGQVSYLIAPLAYVGIGLLPQVIPFIENLIFK